MSAAIPDRDNAGRGQIAVGGQLVTTSKLLDLQRDAARYRWLRDKADSMACTAAPMVASLADDGRMIALIDGEDLDTAVDLAMARTSARRASKTDSANRAEQPENRKVNDDAN